MPLSSSAGTASDSTAAFQQGEAVLEITNLHHRWKGPKPPILEDVSLTLGAGEVTWIGGRNGVGKTTLLRLAAGILLPQSGTVRIGALTSRAKGGRYQRQIGFLSAGDRSLQARMRVTQQLDYWARLAYVPRRAPARCSSIAALQSFGLRGVRRSPGRPDVDGAAPAHPAGDGLPARTAGAAARRAAQLTRRRGLRAAQRAERSGGRPRRHGSLVLSPG